MDHVKAFQDQRHERYRLDISDLLNIELRSDNVQTFDAKRNSPIIAMQKQADEESLEIVHLKQLETSEQFKQFVARNYQKVVTRHQEQNLREKPFSSRDRLGDKLNFAVPALLGTGKEKENTDCNPWVSKGHCSRGQACSFKHEHKRQRIPSPSPRRKSNDTGRNGATVRSINLKGINDLWKETVWTNGGRKCRISIKWKRPRRGACKGSVSR